MTRRTLAAAVTGLVSLSLVGVALANEPDDPGLAPVEDELCEEVVTDGGTTDGTDGATDSTDEATDSTDEATDSTDEATDSTGETDGGEEGCETGTDGDTTDGTDGTDGADGADVADEELVSEDPELDEGERPQNHGWYVSEATKTCPESGRERGECISEVAKSDLGKPHADDEAEGADGDDEPTVDATAEAGPAEKPAKAAKPSKGNGGGKGRGARG